MGLDFSPYCTLICVCIDQCHDIRLSYTLPVMMMMMVMGDKIAQLIFEKIDTPIIRETNDLEDTGMRGKRVWQY